ncbi:inorganic pyrophosphatase [Mesonia phycicola]|uniref:inorganic diphosphatase n=1 Tax=Mesonia phycicola TaxID=579105 RepID=A0A1M6AV16_9FLAO|nr:inorganic diphosphatase [Mesonia phycicola]SHI40325.1 inorganic pyrophosphatase [Mesonia phycicola]
MLRLKTFGLVGSSMNILNFCAGLLSILVLTSCQQENKKEIDYYHLPTYSKNKNIQAVVEIPAGTNHKIEYNKIEKKFINDTLNGKDRIIDFLPYLGNYGFIPSTYSDPENGGDGDALDVLILGENITTGSVVEIIPIGMIELLDNEESDNKIIAIPAEENKRIIKATNFHEFSENYPEIRKMIGDWFKFYDLNDEIQLKRWTGEQAAMSEIEKWRLPNP